MKCSPRPPRGLLLIIFILFFAPTTVWGIDDPALDYHTITTPNFYVHYYDGLEALAKRTAIAAEEAHAILSPLLDWQPRGRTHINVVDQLDTANGWANSQGRNQIAIYGMPPAADSVLGHYDDWLRILVYHEYVHTLHMDTNPGIPQIVNYIVGKQAHPNQILPRWYVEGIATYFESARTGTGRVNSSLYWMWLRTAALQDRFFDLGQSSGLPVQWPSGGAAYLYGGFFMDFVARRHGENFIREFNHIYGARIVPFALNHTATRISGESFDEMWLEWTAEAQGKALAERVAVRALGETPLHLLTDAGGRHLFPRRRPGTGQMSLYRAPQNDEAGYSLVTPSGRLSPLFDFESSAGPTSWSPDGQSLYLSRATVTSGVYTYQDIFRWDAETNRTEQLTSADRAREPAVSPDGKSLVHVRNRAGTMELVLRPLDDFDNEQVLLGGSDHDPEDDAHWQQISMPTWTPDGQGIVFSWWRLDLGRRDLWLLHLDRDGDDRLERLTASATHEMDPTFGPDGLLYFSSDLTGIFNIYAMDIETLESWQVSNVVTGAFSPAVSADGQWIYVSLYEANGFELARFRRPSTLRHRVDFQLRDRTRVIYPDVGELDLTSRPYRARTWLRPLTFMPDLGVFTSGAGISATVEGYDPIGHHQYTLSGGWTSGPDLTDQGANLGAL
ncbi:MAG: TolB family protein, partial [Bradymonadaceae bacterium]